MAASKHYTNKDHSFDLGLLFLIFLSSAPIIIGLFYAVRSYQEAQRHKEIRATIQACKDYIENDLPDDLKKCYEDFPLDGYLNVTADIDSDYISSGDYEMFFWTDTISVEFVTDDSFEELTDRERYNLLAQLHEIGSSNCSTLISERYPWYTDPEEMVTAIREKSFIKHELKETYAIRSSSFRYHYLDESDCYKKEGSNGFRYHVLRDPESKYYIDPNKPKTTPKKTTPKPTKKPTWNYKPAPTNVPQDTDSYDAHLYDDPDDYAFDYAEDFAEEYDEDIDDAYLDAYDYWMEWHDSH